MQIVFTSLNCLASWSLISIEYTLDIISKDQAPSAAYSISRITPKKETTSKMDRFLQDPGGDKLLSEHNWALEAAEAVKGMQFKPKVTRHELLKQFKYRQRMNKDQPPGQDSASTVDVSFAPPIYPP
ncbi:hypothetical protein VN97_g5902 [Penicillium thymicola]|uniref:Uncharacterized protein n=1 Tax=Penicillium thymicola TaxID=293382 RepID=A0AAI9X8I7_PENTH|nr:hypothetical protein VN97_g5902 [Penicillium thymicola]